MTGSSEVDRLAVYGTLVPGGANAHVLSGIVGEWSRGSLVGTRYDDGWHGYPGLTLGGDGRVEVHVLHAAGLVGHLGRLDAFEGPGYRRVVADVRLEDGQQVQAWVYELVGPPG